MLFKSPLPRKSPRQGNFVALRDALENDFILDKIKAVEQQIMMDAQLELESSI